MLSGAQVDRHIGIRSYYQTNINKHLIDFLNIKLKICSKLFVIVATRGSHVNANVFPGTTEAGRIPYKHSFNCIPFELVAYHCFSARLCYSLSKAHLFLLAPVDRLYLNCKLEKLGVLILLYLYWACSSINFKTKPTWLVIFFFQKYNHAIFWHFLPWQFLFH